MGLALLLHVLFLWVIWSAMRPPAAVPVVAVPQHDVLLVRFISNPALAPKPPPAAPLPAPPAPSKPRLLPKPRKPLAEPAMTMQLPSPAPAVTLQLYDKDGEPRLPAAAASAAVPGYVQRMPEGDAGIMQHTSPIPYTPTRFEQYFPPPGETLGGSIVRHVVQAVVKSADVDLPRGVHLKCTTLLGIPIPNCINPPAPPSKKDGDERLSMAPAKPLAVDPQAPPAPSVEACIAMYRAGKPLVWGCPIDTPNRSVDEELRRHSAAGTPPH